MEASSRCDPGRQRNSSVSFSAEPRSAGQGFAVVTVRSYLRALPYETGNVSVRSWKSLPLWAVFTTYGTICLIATVKGREWLASLRRSP